jgi:solute carrier family 6 GABA transporter-like protein 1
MAGVREQWLNRPTFILASIGAAVGLGNFWRFPYLTNKYGGGFFFVPYLIALFTMGIPLLLMELSLGQKFQSGDISVFGGINKRLRGIGIASVFSAYIICFYYNVIISWAIVYFIAAFISPLPWSANNPDFEWKCNKDEMTPAQQFFEIDVIRFKDDNCKDYADGDPSQFSVPAFFATLFVWLTCFLAVFKGVHSSSYLVWFTVPVPLVFIVVMVINNLSLEGAGNGIDKYLNGTPGMEIPSSVWADAVGQIFFSIGVCMGIMTSYGSYNPLKKPIIMDNLVICLSNSTVSFVCGFAVWAIVGFLEAKNSLAKSKTSSAGLAFIAYPTAVDMMKWSNLWAFMLGMTLFLLGVDSAFSMVEATATVLADLKTLQHVPRSFIAFMICFAGFLFSVPFCTNWGFVLFDVIDHYLCTYLLFLCGIFQCFGCGWGFDVEETLQRSPQHALSLKYLSFSFWTYLLIVGLIFVLLEEVPVGIAVLAAGILLFCLLPSFLLSKLPFPQWYAQICMCGVRRLAYSMSKLGRKEPDQVQWWEPAFALYWGFTIKYFVPSVLWFLLVGNTKADIDNPYGKYAAHW